MTTSIVAPQTRYSVPEGAKALVVIVHGLAEYSGRYESVIAFLNARGIGCATFDLRGHGRMPRSESERGDIESFADFVTDSAAVIDAARVKYPGLRLFVWGHSMGAIVATLAASRIASQGPGRIRGVITSSAPIAAFDAYPGFVRSVVAGLAKLFPRQRLKRPFEARFLSRDLEVGNRYAQDPLVPKAITLRLLVGVMQASERCLRVAPKLLLPWLALHGGEDQIAPPIGSQRLIDALGSLDKQLRLWPGARHEVHNEIDPDRTEFLECIAGWMLAHVKSEG